MKSLFGLSVPSFSWIFCSLILSCNIVLIKFLNPNNSLIRARYSEVRPNSNNFVPNKILVNDYVYYVN